VEYVNVADDDWRQQAIAREGNDNMEQIEHLSKLWQILRTANLHKDQWLEIPSDLVSQIVGLPSKSFVTFVQENAHVFLQETV
jgi:hypothetical protein